MVMLANYVFGLISENGDVRLPPVFAEHQHMLRQDSVPFYRHEIYLKTKQTNQPPKA